MDRESQGKKSPKCCVFLGLKLLTTAGQNEMQLLRILPTPPPRSLPLHGRKYFTPEFPIVTNLLRTGIQPEKNWQTNVQI